MGHEFERIAVQGYDRRCVAMNLPLVKEWVRWEGIDRERRSLEIDIVALLSTGGMMTGAVKWNRTPIDASVHRNHLIMLQRAADAGHRWAHEGLMPEATIFYVAAGGVAHDFIEAVESGNHRVIYSTLNDLYAQ